MAAVRLRARGGASGDPESDMGRWRASVADLGLVTLGDRIGRDDGDA